MKKVLKWTGYLTAILSLIAGVTQAVRVVMDRWNAERKINTLLASEAVQVEGQNYASAWDTLEQAARVRGDSTKVHAAQEKLAMVWVDSLDPDPEQHHSDVAQKVEPVLTRGATAAKPPSYRADLLAHLGWCYFLETMDGKDGLDPAAIYAQAVKEDPNNPYAQSMWGYWIVFNHSPAADAKTHFEAALSSGRERKFVREHQIMILLDGNGRDQREELLRALNDARKENWHPPDVFLGNILADYDRMMKDSGPGPEFFSLPPAEHLATFKWLFGDMKPNDVDYAKGRFYTAELEEAAGDKSSAIRDYKEMISHAPYPSTFTKISTAAVARLEKQ